MRRMQMNVRQTSEMKQTLLARNMNIAHGALSFGCQKWKPDDAWIKRLAVFNFMPHHLLTIGIYFTCCACYSFICSFEMLRSKMHAIIILYHQQHTDSRESDTGKLEDVKMRRHCNLIFVYIYDCNLNSPVDSRTSTFIRRHN